MGLLRNRIRRISDGRLLRSKDAEFKALHDGVGQQLFARLSHQTLRLFPAARFDVHGDVLANPNVGELLQTDVGQVVRHRLSLGVEQGWKGKDVNGRVKEHVQGIL
jgi:hypothetical protein